MQRLSSLDYADESDTCPYSPSFAPEKLEIILDAKAKGNSAYKNADNKTAIYEYSRGLDCFDGIINSPSTPTTPPATDLSDTSPLFLLTMLLSNRAAAYINTLDFERALYDSKGIIKYRPNWVKGYYRKGESLKGLRQFQLALDCFSMALTFDQRSSSIRSNIFKCKFQLEDDENGIKCFF
ncbi:hypothetical protein BC833DRAFT_522813 [Globomyces pollinis-pini]|nr:hypothetical protein BC833DRAFT_522813 [Globomyces pollinis-pini]